MKISGDNVSVLDGLKTVYKVIPFRNVFKTTSYTYDGAFLWKNCIIDVWLGSIYTSSHEDIFIFYIHAQP